MLGKIFATADGKIPYIQIIVGAVLGAIGMLVYAKFFKPRILYEEKFTVPLGPSVEKKPKPVEDSRPQKKTSGGGQNTVDISGQKMTAPLIFEMESIQIPRGAVPPVLPNMTEISDRSDTSSISGSEAEDDDDMEEYSRDDETGANDTGDRMSLPPIQ